MRFSFTTLAYCFACIAAFVSPVAVFAQVDLTGTEYLVTLSESPTNPAPNSSVTFSLTSGFIDLSSATITWYANNARASSGVGNRLFTTTSGNAGTQTTIRAVVSAPDGTQAQAQALLAPMNVTLVWEASSYTPPFFGGKALPTAGTVVHVHADASVSNSASANYAWSINGQSVANISGVGKSDISVTAPAYPGALVVGVVVSSDTSSARGSASTRIASVQPLLALYPTDPVTGVVYGHKLAPTDTIRSDWNTLDAEPYYLSVDVRTAYLWQVNGQSVLADAQSPQQLTITPGSPVSITLAVQSAQSTTPQAQSSWIITAKNSASGF